MWYAKQCLCLFVSLTVLRYLFDRAWKVAPALACGCTIVMKPSEFTPLSALVRSVLTSQPLSEFRRFLTVEYKRCLSSLLLLISLILNAFALSSCLSLGRHWLPFIVPRR